jgi:tRNA(Ile2) C34 agmatinyltransferase TiaS
MATDKGTTRPGFVSRNGQIVIRKTGARGSDHLQYVYELECNRCGHHYGANGSDIHDRKCPKCDRSAQPGLPLD